MIRINDRVQGEAYESGEAQSIVCGFPRPRTKAVLLRVLPTHTLPTVGIDQRRGENTPQHSQTPSGSETPRLSAGGHSFRNLGGTPGKSVPFTEREKASQTPTHTKVRIIPNGWRSPSVPPIRPASRTRWTRRLLSRPCFCAMPAPQRSCVPYLHHKGPGSPVWHCSQRRQWIEQNLGMSRSLWPRFSLGAYGQVGHHSQEIPPAYLHVRKVSPAIWE